MAVVVGEPDLVTVVAAVASLADPPTCVASVVGDGLGVVVGVESGAVGDDAPLLADPDAADPDAEPLDVAGADPVDGDAPLDGSDAEPLPEPVEVVDAGEPVETDGVLDDCEPPGDAALLGDPADDEPPDGAESAGVLAGVASAAEAELLEPDEGVDGAGAADGGDGAEAVTEGVLTGPLDVEPLDCDSVVAGEPLDAAEPPAGAGGVAVTAGTALATDASVEVGATAAGARDAQAMARAQESRHAAANLEQRRTAQSVSSDRGIPSRPDNLL